MHSTDYLDDNEYQNNEIQLNRKFTCLSTMGTKHTKPKIIKKLTQYEMDVIQVKEKQKIKAPDFKKTIGREQLDTIYDSGKTVIPLLKPDYASVTSSTFSSFNLKRINSN